MRIGDLVVGVAAAAAIALMQSTHMHTLMENTDEQR
jgi:hypothetical protein